MINRTSGRRWATLASGALLAGGLVAAPAVTGLSTASAAITATDIAYSCSYSGFPLGGTLDLTVATPDSATVGQAVNPDVSATFTWDSSSADLMRTAQFKSEPNSTTFTLDTTTGDKAGSMVLSMPDSSVPASGAVTWAGSGSWGAIDTSQAGTVPLSVGNATLKSKVSTILTGGQVADATMNCSDTTTKIGEFTVEGDGPVEPGTPEGILYHCDYSGIPLDAYIDLDADLPSSTDQGSGLNPDVDATITWSDDAATAFRGVGLDAQGGSLDLSTAFGQGEGTTDITLDETDVPAEGDVVWTGSGKYGVLDTSVPGKHDLTVGDGTIMVHGSVAGAPAAMDVTLDCAVAEGEDTTIGSVTVNDTTGPVAVKGKVKIKGVAKVGKKLTAKPGKAPGAKVSYQWLANGKNIKKATGKKLKLTQALKGKKVKVRATYSDPEGQAFDVVQTSKAVKVKKAKKAKKK